MQRCCHYRWSVKHSGSWRRCTAQQDSGPWSLDCCIWTVRRCAKYCRLGCNMYIYVSYCVVLFCHLFICDCVENSLQTGATTILFLWFSILLMYRLMGPHSETMWDLLCCFCGRTFSMAFRAWHLGQGGQNPTAQWGYETHTDNNTASTASYSSIQHHTVQQHRATYSHAAAAAYFRITMENLDESGLIIM